MDEQLDRQVPDKTALERLGRERPATFPNKWIELCFCFSLLASELLTKQSLVDFVTADSPRLTQTHPDSSTRLAC